MVALSISADNFSFVTIKAKLILNWLKFGVKAYVKNIEFKFVEGDDLLELYK